MHVKATLSKFATCTLHKPMVLINEFLQAQIDFRGAELKSLKRIQDGYEYLWNADPQYWAKTSPVLFPIVGALKDDTYFYKGRSYHLPRHGFARDHRFDGKQLSDTEGVFTLQDTEETREAYPFAFQLVLRYELVGHTLRCTYEVNNPSPDQPLFFSIGAHPAFAVHTDRQTLRYEDHYLQFPQDDVLHCHVLEGNLIGSHVNTIKLNGNRLPLTHELFYGDALVMKTLRSREITLGNRANDRGIRFRYENFPFFGIWAAKGADFVCLEPWCGIADAVTHNQQLEEKEGIQCLEAGKTWARRWEVALIN